MRWNALLTLVALLLAAAPALAAPSSGAGGAKVWGYDLPYSEVYGAGVPFYVGHNNGAPDGTIYERPAYGPNGVAEPGLIYGDPEDALITNFSYAFPALKGLKYGERPSLLKFAGLE